VKGRKAEGRMAEKQGRRSEGRTFCRAAVDLGLPGLLPFCLAALSLTGCTHAQAKTTPEMPALEMPPPPPRDVEPSEAEAPPPMPLVAEPARTAPARPRPAPAAPRPETPRPADTPAAVEPPKPADDASHPPPTLHTAPATAEGDVERGIRASLQRATADLNRVDYRALDADARTQYDTAKRFARQAEDAMRAKNLVFAKQLAEKAASLASQLAGR
jgi:outer membrane biosynthesis protein TonB